MDNRVSIVVTCYNHEPYIKQCLESILSQSHHNIELIVFNDGSTDASDEIITSVLKDSPFKNTKYFSADNQGVATVRNQAMKEISGEFLLFVDSDDYLDSDYVEVLLDTMLSEEADIVYCQLWDFERKVATLNGNLVYSLDKILNGNFISISSLVRVSKIGATCFDTHLKTIEDYDFWLNLILNRAAKPYFTSKTKLNYRMLEDSRNQSENWEQYYESYFYILNKYRNIIDERIIEATKHNVMLWVKSYQTECEKLEITKQELSEQRNQFENTIHDIYNSKSFKIGSFQVSIVKSFIRIICFPLRLFNRN